MADMKSKVKHSFDAEASVTLRDITDGAETADAAETGVALPALTKAYWDNNDIAQDAIACVVHVTAIDFGDANEVYVLNIQVDSALAFDDAPVTVGTITIPAVGVYTVLLDTDTVKALDANAAFIRANLDVSGTTPSITYGAWIAPVI